mmetsp:Transcript_19166/g.36695  ORF Transcript_19166/g.36695 Transcript_19166/m.36695 type:complete len:277 (+) Transcript_19166:1071-1901(+)
MARPTLKSAMFPMVRMVGSALTCPFSVCKCFRKQGTPPSATTLSHSDCVLRAHSCTSKEALHLTAGLASRRALSVGIATPSSTTRCASSAECFATCPRHSKLAARSLVLDLGLLSMAATSGRARASTTRAASASLYVAVSARLLQITVLSPSGASANCRLATISCTAPRVMMLSHTSCPDTTSVLSSRTVASLGPGSTSAICICSAGSTSADNTASALRRLLQAMAVNVLHPACCTALCGCMSAVFTFSSSLGTISASSSTSVYDAMVATTFRLFI